MRPWKRSADGLRLKVRLTPRAARDDLTGIHVGADGVPHLAVRVRAAPVDGAANAALVALIAKSLGVAKSAVAVTAGHGARTKTLTISGDPEILEARLESFARPRG